MENFKDSEGAKEIQRDIEDTINKDLLDSMSTPVLIGCGNLGSSMTSALLKALENLEGSKVLQTSPNQESFDKYLIIDGDYIDKEFIENIDINDVMKQPIESFEIKQYRDLSDQKETSFDKEIDNEPRSIIYSTSHIAHREKKKQKARKNRKNRKTHRK